MNRIFAAIIIILIVPGCDKEKTMPKSRRAVTERSGSTDSLVADQINRNEIILSEIDLIPPGKAIIIEGLKAESDGTKSVYSPSTIKVESIDGKPLNKPDYIRIINIKGGSLPSKVKCILSGYVEHGSKATAGQNTAAQYNRYFIATKVIKPNNIQLRQTQNMPVK